MKNIPSQLPILYFDGGSRGNPGKAAGAAVIVMPNGEQFTVSRYLDFATNNEAEYTGLIIGLQKAQTIGINDLIVQGDSQLVINQIQGQWQVKSPNLQAFYQEAKDLIKGFKKITINWVRRQENHLADAAANQCMNQGKKNQGEIPKKTVVTNHHQPAKSPILSNSKKCYYDKGDIIMINNPLEANIKHEAVVIDNPEQTKEGKWRIIVEI